MKLALWFASLVLMLFAAMHIFIAVEHWYQAGPNRESVVGPMLIALAAASFAAWIFRRARRCKPAA